MQTHIYPLVRIWHDLKQKSCWALYLFKFFFFYYGLWDVWTQHGERWGQMETRREEKKESEERWEQTNKTNLVKPSAGLGLGLEWLCVYVWGDLNRVAGIRTDPGLSNAQLADDPILEHSTAQQPPWDPQMRACICVCVYRRVLNWCAYQCARFQKCSCSNKCLCVSTMHTVYVYREGR